VDPTGTKIKFIAFQKDSNVRDGLRLLAALCKKNIVPSSRVDGPLTISRLYNVTFDEALNAVLGYGFKYEVDGDFVRVYTAEEYKKIKEDPERMVHKVITLYYMTADEAIKLITPVLSGAPSAKVTASTPAENSISAAEGSLSGSGGGDDPASNDMIVLFDYPENIERAEAVIREIDARPKQVLIEATIMSATLTEDMRFGIDWNLLNGVGINGFPTNTAGGQGAYVEQEGFAKPFLDGLRVGFSANNVQAIITALENITDTTLLANPKILAVNKQEGSVLIGKKIGYYDQTTQTTTSTTQSVKFLETGTRLVFRPYIGNDGYIRMDIYPKDSDGSLKSNGLPEEITTELRTNVIVRDGETVVIGGLFRDVVSTSRNQVPVLGSLPLVGGLFRGTYDKTDRQEVVILLTPHLIDVPSQTRGEERADDVRRKREGALDALQPLQVAKLAEDAYARAAKYYLEGDTEKAVYNLKCALMLRPTYLEALRLRERIVAETDPEQLKRFDSMVMQKVDEQDAENWMRL
jgi:type II secretory pathway component GspD/PulD (secretin)